jgi:hypothetical protein
MKRLILFSMLCTVLGFPIDALAGNYYQRPTANANSSNATLLGGNQNYGSTSLSAVYSGKSGNGPVGSSGSEATPTSSGISYNYTSARVLTNWQSYTSTPVSVTLNASLSCSISPDGQGDDGGCIAWYSTNAGSSWTSFYTYDTSDGSGDSQHTVSIVVTGISASNIQVGITAYADCNSDTDFGCTAGTITVYDVWTTETTGGSGYDGGTFETSELDPYGIWEFSRRTT